MDSVTHIALGACTAEIILGKKLGKKVLFWGIVAQNLPDIDGVATFFTSSDKGFLVHRGITHSLLFAIVVGLGLAFLVKKIHFKKFPLVPLVLFFCFQLALHDLLDTCNSYGTGLLEPFSNHRFSINLLYVADPLFTISLLIAAIFLVFKSTVYIGRVRVASVAVGISVLYLCFAGFNKIKTDEKAEAAFRQQGIDPSGYFSTPAPLTSMLWYIAADAGNSYYTAYSSVYDDPKLPIAYEQYPKNYNLLTPTDDPVVQTLTAFANGYYTISKTNNTLYFNVLRFEQVQGWRIANAPFAFSYPLATTGDQGMLLQKGRFSGWDEGSVKIYLRRIAGKQTK